MNKKKTSVLLLLLAGAGFAYSGFYVLSNVIDPVRLGHIVGALSVPILLIMLGIKEWMAIHKENQKN